MELFDLDSDPGEKSDLAAANPAELTRLQSLLSAWKKRNAPGIRGASAAADDDDGRPKNRKKERRKKKG
jgi:hypothetical protein